MIELPAWLFVLLLIFASPALFFVGMMIFAGAIYGLAKLFGWKIPERGS